MGTIVVILALVIVLLLTYLIYRNSRLGPTGALIFLGGIGVGYLLCKFVF